MATATNTPCACRDGIYHAPSNLGVACFRCGGKGFQDADDRRRNAAYDHFAASRAAKAMMGQSSAPAPSAPTIAGITKGTRIEVVKKTTRGKHAGLPVGAKGVVVWIGSTDYGVSTFLKVDGETDVRKYVPVEKLRALVAPVVNPNVDTSLPMLPPVGV